MLNAIIVAIIGALGTVIAAMLGLMQRRQTEFRSESNSQHGHLLGLVEKIDKKTTDTAIDIALVKKELRTHIVEHQQPPVTTMSTPTVKVPKPRKKA